MTDWLVVCEDQLQFDVCTDLADRVAVETCEWTDGQLDEFRTWVGFRDSRHRANWSEVKGGPLTMIALAIPEIEAWVIAGFEAADDAERRSIETQCKLPGSQIGNDPPEGREEKRRRQERGPERQEHPQRNRAVAGPVDSVLARNCDGDSSPTRYCDRAHRVS